MNTIASPLVSIVIPTYNHAHFLGRALQSVRGQTYSNWEAIVIDNHSQDNTDEVVGKFADPRITLLKIHNNGVIAASRNAGIRAAKGEWIAFLDSDDWWTADKLASCLNCANAATDIVYHTLEIVREKSSFFQLKEIKSWQVSKPVIVDLLVRGNALATSSVVVRKSRLDEIGGIDERVDMVAAEDYNTWLRIAEKTEGFAFIPKRLGFYTLHNQGVSRKDMSEATRCAGTPFTYLLDERQKLKYDANLRYTKGRFAFNKGEFARARQELSYSLRYGKFILKLKSIFMLLNIEFSKRSNRDK